MPVRRLLLATTAALTLSLAPAGTDWCKAAAQSAPMFSGQVSSAEEGAMEGVVVSAKQAGSTITVSVISNQQGNFNFPSGRLEPGSYTLRIRAAGYELDGPRTVDVGPQGAPVAIKLRKARNLAAQLTSGEWLMSIPGTIEQKNMLDRCTSCHTLERPIKSTYDADALTGVLQRMAS
jgi:virginiamycin B lyase